MVLTTNSSQFFLGCFHFILNSLYKDDQACLTALLAYVLGGVSVVECAGNQIKYPCVVLWN